MDAPLHISSLLRPVGFSGAASLHRSEKRHFQTQIGTGICRVNTLPLSARYHKNLLSQPVLSRTYSRPNWAEVSLSALRHNFRLLQRHVGPEVTICSVVKCDAYGHGYAECARALQDEGGRWFGVTSTDEGVALRESGITGRVLIMVGVWRGEEEDALHYSLTPAISRIDELDALARAARKLGLSRPVAVHLKVDTGMARLGLPLAELEKFVAALGRAPEIELEGVFSHLASSEVLDDSDARQQIRRFEEALSVLARHGLNPPIRHLANSSAAIARPEARYNFIRPGLAIYGYQLPFLSGDGDLADTASARLELQPVLQWKTRVISLRDVAAGQPLGYGGTYVTSAPARIAVIAAGYGDGYSRKNSYPRNGKVSAESSNGNVRDRSSVLVRARRAPVLGRVSMDTTIVDVTHIGDCEIGDEVVLIGRSGGEEITAWDLARWSETLPYEVLCNLSERVLRRYV
ncbi:MAG: alanine racemase [Candidatus Korobacteraceae bacterium]